MIREHPRSGTGKIILLNGASSSGKTTIAHLLQSSIDQPFWHFSIDHLREAGVLPMDRIRSGEFVWAGLRESFFAGFHAALAAYARAGNNLIVEHIVETPAWMAVLVRALEGIDVFFVAIHCPLEELERRELERGDRPVGDARRDFVSIHQHARYDLELDATRTPESNVALLIHAWRQRAQPSAFEQLALRLG